MRRRGLLIATAIACGLAPTSCQLLLVLDDKAASTSAGVDGDPDPGALEAGDAPAESSPDGAPCVTESPWATVDGGVPYATCDDVPQVSLLDSSEHCGRCNRSCGGTPCVGGMCVPLGEAQEIGGKSLAVLGAFGDEVLYFVGEVDLMAVVARRKRTVASFLLQSQGDGGANYRGGGVAGAPSDLFVHTRRLLFHVAGDAGPTQRGGLLPNQNYEMRWFAKAGDRLGYTTRFELVLLSTMGTVLDAPLPAPFSRDVVASAGEFYWMQQPWNGRAGGSPDAAAETQIRKTVTAGEKPPSQAVVRDEKAHLTGLASATDGIYFARIGPGGGIFRLPPGADFLSEPIQVAADDSLVVSTSIAVDDTHVYWMRANGPEDGQIVKRSKCGSATVTLVERVLSKQVGDATIVSLGSRIYYSEGSRIWSVAK